MVGCWPSGKWMIAIYGRCGSVQCLGPVLVPVIASLVDHYTNANK